MPSDNLYGEDRLGIIMPRLNKLYWIDENELSRAEFLLIRPESAPEFEAYIQRKGAGFSFGIHLPLLWPPDYDGNPLHATLIDPDERRRNRTLELLNENLALANEWGADYVLVHLQRPTELLDGCDAAGAGPRLTYRILDSVLPQVERMSVEARVPVFLENMMAHPALWKAQDYIDICEAWPELRLCLDIDHLSIDAQLRGFDVTEAFEALLPYAGSMHLSNYRAIGPPLVRLDMELFRNLRRKVPVHPEQDPAGAWLDVAQLVRMLARGNPEAYVIFEAYPANAPDEAYIWEGIQWMKGVYSDARRQARAQDAGD